jgi:hypothetical protein
LQSRVSDFFSCFLLQVLAQQPVAGFVSAITGWHCTNRGCAVKNSMRMVSMDAAGFIASLKIHNACAVPNRLSLIVLAHTGLGNNDTADMSADCIALRGAYAASIFLQASAQRLQAVSHSWQCSLSCLPHSAAHASQSSAHTWQMALHLELPRLISCAAALQIAAHSISSCIHIAIMWTSFSEVHDEAQ